MRAGCRQPLIENEKRDAIDAHAARFLRVVFDVVGVLVAVEIGLCRRRVEAAGTGNFCKDGALADMPAFEELGGEQGLDQYRRLAGVGLLCPVDLPVRGQRIGAQFDLLEGEVHPGGLARLAHPLPDFG